MKYMYIFIFFFLKKKKTYRYSYLFNFINQCLEDPNNIYVTTFNETMKEISSPYYFLLPFLNYLPRTEAFRKMSKLNSLYDEIIENKRKSMKTGELDRKINNNSADLLECMIKASNDPENPTLTSEELRVSYNFFKKKKFFFLTWNFINLL